MHRYLIGGLSVCSEIVLPGLIGAAATPMPDVTIEEGDVPEALENAVTSGPTWAIEGNRFLLRIPDIARFLLTDGREIIYTAEGGGTLKDVAIFLIGTVFGILLHQRGSIVLHASGIRVNGRAVLFCGASGAGKSTLAAALGQRGFPLVTDDFCAVTLGSDGSPLVQPDGRQLKLWAQTIEALGLGNGRGSAVRDSLEKYYFEPWSAHSTPLPLGAIYALREARPPHAAGIQRPNIVDSALIIRRNAYRPLLVNRMSQKPAYFRAATRIANSSGIFHLTRALDFSHLADVISGLEQHWSEIGLVESRA